MRLIAVTDLHGRLEVFQQILDHAGPADAVLLGGDITNFGSPIDVDRIVERAQQHLGSVLAVAGNCDSAEIDGRLQQRGVALHGRGVRWGPVGIHGLSAIPPWKRGMYQLTEDELAAALESGYAALNGAEQHVLLAHVPPRGLRVDRTFFWKHAGSTALRTFIDRTHPALVFCGHIHEGRGIEPLGRTTVVNCGLAARGQYALAELHGDAWHVELHDARERG